jgi:hypothetical protein
MYPAEVAEYPDGTPEAWLIVSSQSIEDELWAGYWLPADML